MSPVSASDLSRQSQLAHSRLLLTQADMVRRNSRIDRQSTAVIVTRVPSCPLDFSTVALS